MNELSVIDISFSISSLNDLREFSKVLAASELVPKDYRGKPDNVLAGILFGRELGLSPLQSLQNVANINGRPGIWGDAAKALVESSGLAEVIREWFELDGKTIGESDAFEAIVLRKNVVAKCFTKRKNKEEGKTFEFSWRMAEKAGLTQKDTPWKFYPVRMLQMKPRGFALRDEYPDVLKGMRLTEELMGSEIELEQTGDGQYAVPRATQDLADGAIEEIKTEGTTLAVGRSTGTPKPSALAAKLQMPKASPSAPQSQPLPKPSETNGKSGETKPAVTQEEPVQSQQGTESKSPAEAMQQSAHKGPRWDNEPSQEDGQTEHTEQVQALPDQESMKELRVFAKKLINELSSTSKGGAILLGIYKDHRIKDPDLLTDDPAIMNSLVKALQMGIKKVAESAKKK